MSSQPEKAAAAATAATAASALAARASSEPPAQKHETKDVLLLDGGTGEELMRRGLPDDRRTWSALAVTDSKYHELLVDVHTSFLRAGSRFITVNNYGVTPGVGFTEEEVLKHTLVAAKLARKAVHDFGEGYVCGSLPPLVESYRPDLVQAHEKGVAMYRKIATVLHPHVDYFLAETLSSSEEMSQAVDAIMTLGLEPIRPLFCSWTVSRGGILRSGEPVEDAVKSLLDRKSAASPDRPFLLAGILFNCSEPEAITESLQALSPLRSRMAAADVKLGAYANRLTPIASDWSLETSAEPQALRDDLTPELYCNRFVGPWIADMGVSLVGENAYCGNSVKVLSRVWILTQLATIALVIAGFALGSDRSDVGYAFIGVWVALLAIFLGVVGTLVMRKYRTVATHGALTGMSFMMAQQGSTPAESAVGAFSVLLFFLYLLFTWLLVKFRADIIAFDEDEEDEGLTAIEMNGMEEDEVNGGVEGTETGAINGNAHKAHEEGTDLKMV
ncbi:Hypothetical Protein FCC1311_110452 [Hondaea fermentalgiana]|uniref:Hcy-binding domain-containing protein n=1 Tax=Hondaea fermentalgiana TaxID=2315210 RepID=A0A2R5H171_9STRA|nr:Hypothetical Protein FCC1311_110452 [Hondaea fermentalgiana]|eukprot:GBG34823.1 Hypothetical Protein FCC1311_110452 [Hondaea fermentalgiana]